MKKPLEKGMLVCWNAADKQFGIPGHGHIATSGQMFYIGAVKEGQVTLEFFENRNHTLGWTDAKNVIPFKAAKKLITV